MNIAKDVTVLPFLLLLFAFSVHAEIYFEEDINDCTDGETCMEIGFCPSAIEIVNKREKPKPCGFIGKVPFVCCPDKVANNPIYVELNVPISASQSKTNSSVPVIPSSTSTTTTTTTTTTTSTTTTAPIEKITTAPIEKTTLSNEPIVVETTIGNTETTPLLNVKNSEYVYGSKATKQCDKSYERVTVDENGYIVFSNVKRDKPTLTENSPHAAALGNKQGDKIEWLCAGSLISEKFVLTAAHCIEDNAINYVRVGDLDLTNNSDNVDPQNFTVVNVILHPNYTKPIRYHDIGVLELDRPIVVTKFVKPGCLHLNTQLSETNLHLIGFSDNSATNKMYSITVANTDKRICNYHFNLPMYKEFLPNGPDYETQFCASGFFKSSPCQRDTGGPVQVNNWSYTEGRLLIGVTSIEKLCNDKNAPGLYLRIARYLPWIESVVWPDL